MTFRAPDATLQPMSAYANGGALDRRSPARAQSTKGRIMPGRLMAGVAGLAALALFCAPGPASAASFDCRAPRLQPAEKAICSDAQLSRADEQLARRLAGFTRRLTFGQYLGLRFWQARWKETRDGCSDNRPCLAAAYRAQNRLLDGLDVCLDTSVRRRACLQATLGQREARRR
jgi:uncharacterized protein